MVHHHNLNLERVTLAFNIRCLMDRFQIETAPDLAHRVGMDIKTLEAIFTQDADVDDIVLLRIADSLGVSTDDLTRAIPPYEPSPGLGFIKLDRDVPIPPESMRAVAEASAGPGSDLVERRIGSKRAPRI